VGLYRRAAGRILNVGVDQSICFGPLEEVNLGNCFRPQPNTLFHRLKIRLSPRRARAGGRRLKRTKFKAAPLATFEVTGEDSIEEVVMHTYSGEVSLGVGA
jgi:hypothetical protein